MYGFYGKFVRGLVGVWVVDFVGSKRVWFGGLEVIVVDGRSVGFGVMVLEFVVGDGFDFV